MAMSSLSRLLSVAIITTLFACGGSASEASDEDALGELGDGTDAPAATQDVKLVVKATDSKAAKSFLSAFVNGFVKIVEIDRRDRMRGASSNEEMEEKLYKAQRNDGSIECNDSDECTFNLKKAKIVKGQPVLKGDQNTWAGQMFSIFVGRSGSALGGNQSQHDSVVIGKKDTVPSIECKVGPSERGLETAECVFNIKW